MVYRATIIINNQRITKDFPTLSMAAQWLDLENNNLDATTMIETFDESGNKKDGFIYTEKIK